MMKSEFDGVVERLLNGKFRLEEAVKVLERGMIHGALQRAEGNQSEAAKQLGIHRNTLQRKIAEYELTNGRTRRKPAARAVRVRKPKSGAA